MIKSIKNLRSLRFHLITRPYHAYRNKPAGFFSGLGSDCIGDKEIILHVTDYPFELLEANILVMICTVNIFFRRL